MPPCRGILIAGPTAGGKSAAALALAERLNGVVINADSMQVYRELRVLTARPGRQEEARVPHALYGVLPARDAYSVGRWLEDARSAIAAAEAQGRLPVVTGGTGLYFKALLEGLSPVPDIPRRIRDHWRAAAQTRSAPELHAILAERDPVMAARLRPSDPQRIVRALEVVDATGRSLAEWQDKRGVPVLAPDEAARFVVAPERAALYARIDSRFDAMLAEGALEEARALKALHLSPESPVMRAHGVAPLLAHLDGVLTLDAAAQTAKTQTRRYAKRQLTWARRNMIAWNWITEKDSERIIDRILSFICG